MGGTENDLGLARAPAIHPRAARLDYAALIADHAGSQLVSRVDGAARVAGPADGADDAVSRPVSRVDGAARVAGPAGGAEDP